MVGRVLAPVGLHPQQNGGVNLERVPKELEVSQTIASEQSVTLKNKRSIVKRKITIHLKALSSEIEHFGSKFRIRRIIADLKQYFNTRGRAIKCTVFSLYA